MPDPITQSKTALRDRIHATLELLTPPQRHAASAAACARLMDLTSFSDAAVIMLYMPLVNEVDVTPVALRCFCNGQTVCVPKVDWHRRQMQAIEVNSLDDHVLDCDLHGVRTPRQGRPVLPQMIDLIIVPARAYDADGNRLGRGGGYYDRFLSDLRPDAIRMGLVFDQQMVDRIPVSEHDQRVDVIVTDRRVFRTGADSARR